MPGPTPIYVQDFEELLESVEQRSNPDGQCFVEVSITIAQWGNGQSVRYLLGGYHTSDRQDRPRLVSRLSARFPHTIWATSFWQKRQESSDEVTIESDMTDS